jgi:hypothetical protein
MSHFHLSQEFRMRGTAVLVLYVLTSWGLDTGTNLSFSPPLNLKLWYESILSRYSFVYCHKDPACLDFLPVGRTANKHGYVNLVARLQVLLVREDLNLGLIFGSWVKKVLMSMTFFAVRNFLPQRIDKIWPSSTFIRLDTLRYFFSISTLQFMWNAVA